MLLKMIRRFDPSDEQTIELRSDLASIGQKVDAQSRTCILSSKWPNCLTL